jgi:hypothetical protein
VQLVTNELLDRAISLTNRIPVIAGASEIRVRKSYPSVRTPAQHIPRRRLAVRAEEKSRLRIHVRVSPAVEDDSGDVTSRIESAGREHVAELVTERALVLREGRSNLPIVPSIKGMNAIRRQRRWCHPLRTIE